MSDFLRKWLAISFLNLMVVAILGVILRYKIAFYLPFIQQKHFLHSHSHFAFSGWLTQTLFVLLVHYLGLKKGESVITKYRWILLANCLSAYGMLVSFILQGYGFFSISFSTLSIFVSYRFAWLYWKDLNSMSQNWVSHYWLKASLVFNVISSIGAFSLAYLMANKIAVQNFYLSAVYLFLHFQYNGWFFFAGMGLLVSKFDHVQSSFKSMKTVFFLFCFACVPAYFLSALWLPIPTVLYIIIVVAVLAQLLAWVIMVRVFIMNQSLIKQQFSKYGKILLLLASIAFTIKLLLQSGSLHPQLSQLSYGFRPIVIGYLHLVLLAVTSIFIIGYIVSFEMVKVTKSFLWGIFIFVSGVIINELLLMVQGVCALSYTAIPAINELLLFAAVVLLTGIAIAFVSCYKSAFLSVNNLSNENVL
jgi:hypothetical protein